MKNKPLKTMADQSLIHSVIHSIHSFSLFVFSRP